MAGPNSTLRDILLKAQKLDMLSHLKVENQKNTLNGSVPMK